MAGIDTILTAIQNGVQQVGNLAQTYLNVQGAQNYSAITSTLLVKNGVGRLASVSVTTAGSADGVIYDSIDIASTTKPIYVIPMTVGVTVVNLPFSFGLVVAPGTGQVVTVSYS